MNRPAIPGKIRSFFPKEAQQSIEPSSQQDFEDRKGETRRVVKRLAVIVEEHRLAAQPLGIDFVAEDLRSVIHALKDHARGGDGLPIQGARDEIHAHVLHRLFEELVEEPSNILFTTITGPETTRYDAMEPQFWIECLDAMKSKYCPAD